MEELVAWIGYAVTSMALLGLVLVAIRLLPFISTVAATFALLQYALPNMALFESKSPKNMFVFAVLFVAITLSMALDTGSVLKRLSHFWDIPKKVFTKD